MNLNAKNEYYLTKIGNRDYIKLLTNGKYKKEVIVDLHTWKNYLYKFSWTVTKNKKYSQIKTSLNKHSVRMCRMIIENEKSELDYWGNGVDHINNNPLDNRVENLRIYNSKLNSTNIRSKYSDDDMHMIHTQGYKAKNGEYRIYSYKVHANIFDETKYQNFSTIEEAKEYRDNILIPYISRRIEDLKKKTRDIEFERGLRDKLNNNEIEEVKSILQKYNIL
ncbi:HNH endonuclease [Salibacterium sp. K-3]